MALQQAAARPARHSYRLWILPPVMHSGAPAAVTSMTHAGRPSADVMLSGADHADLSMTRGSPRGHPASRATGGLGGCPHG